MENILTIKNLNVSFHVYGGSIKAVTNLSLTIRKKEVYALVGESGCGKSSVANTILGLQNENTSFVEGELLKLDTVDVLQSTEKEMEKIREHLVGMIFQDPLTSLNPTMKIGKQIVEILYRRKKKSSQECKEEAIRLLKLVQIPDAEVRYDQYPHQLSGGMKQRIMIAMSLVGNPKLLIADEPTTSLDVTTQSSVLQLLKDIKEKENTAILFITHDFGVVANIADKVGVMYAGEIVEEGDVDALFYQPIHPYTQSLLKCLPSIDVQSLANIPGEPPNLFEDIVGCPFAPRCNDCMNICLKEKPPLVEVTKEHYVKCFKIFK